MTSKQCNGPECDECNDDDGHEVAVEADDEEPEQSRPSTLLISATEEKDLSQLLTRFEYDVSGIADFHMRLQQELSTLEVRFHALHYTQPFHP